MTLLHRRDVFQASDALLAELQQLRGAGRIAVVAAQINAVEVAEGRLAALRVVDAEGHPHSLPLDMLLAVLGISPRLGQLPTGALRWSASSWW